MRIIGLMTLFLTGLFCGGPVLAQAPVDLSTKAQAGMQKIEVPENTKKLELNLVWGDRLKPPPQYTRSILNLIDAIKKWTTLPVTLGPNVWLRSPEIMSRPVIIVSTNEQFDLTEQEIGNLREYIEKGGFLFFDDAGANVTNSPSGASLLSAVKAIAGKNKLETVSSDHSIFQSPFLLGSAPVGLKANDGNLHMGSGYRPSGASSDGERNLLGVSIDGRLAILYSPRGYYVQWNDMRYVNQLKLGVNIVMYALGLE